MMAQQHGARRHHGSAPGEDYRADRVDERQWAGPLDCSSPVELSLALKLAIDGLPRHERVPLIDQLSADLDAARVRAMESDIEAVFAEARPSPGVAAGKAAAQQLMDQLNAHPDTELLSAGGMARFAGKSRNWPAESARKGRLISVEHAGKTLYPAFQIDPERREPRQWVIPVVDLLDDQGMGGRSFVLWAASPSDRFDGEAPAFHVGEHDFLIKAAGDLAAA